MPRQARQSLFQFLIPFFTTLFTGLLVYPDPPSDLQQLLQYIWLPTLNGAVTALGVFAVAKADTGGSNDL